MRLAELRMVPAPGDGVVARWPGFALVAAGGDAAVMADLVGLVRAAVAEGADAATFAHRLAGFITAGEPALLPAFAALADDDVGIAVLLRGDARLDATAAGETTSLSGTDRPTWVDDFLREEYDRVVVAVGGGAPALDDICDLEAGVVPGVGAVLVPSDRTAEQPAVAAPAVQDAAERSTDEAPIAPEAQAEEPVVDAAGAPAIEDETPAPAEPEPAAREFVSVDFGAEAEVDAREPLPVARAATEEPVPLGTGPKPAEAPPGARVRGLRCIRGHFNHPVARFCALCGISMVQQTQVLVEGERPPLGILVFSDGRTLALDAEYLLGRDPSIDDSVRTGALRPMVLDDPDQILSRVHCEVRLAEWDVQLVDRNSSNGTFVRGEGADEWRRLPPDEPATLAPGMEAKVGSHQFVYESHHQQG